MKGQRWLKLVRIIISLFFLAGFLLVFSDVRAKLPSTFSTILTYFQFWPSIQKYSSIPGILAIGFVFVIIFTLIAGRVYCSTICPLGILQDAMIFIQKITYGKRSKYRYKKPLNFIRYSILGFLTISLLFAGIFAINLLDPFANFGRIASTIYQPIFIIGNNFVSKILMHFGFYSLQPLPIKEFNALPFFFALCIFLTLISMVIYRGRLYCNTICPVGAFLGLVSKVSFLKIRISKNQCSQCGKCQTVCKANCINVKTRIIDESRCIACFNCINSCENSSIVYVKALSRKDKPVLMQDINKRNFLKSGAIYVTSFPLIAHIVKLGDGNITTIRNHDSENPQNSPGDFRTRGPISPPGSKGIDNLKANCIGCQLCISVCPTKVLQPSFLEYGFTGMMLPRMNNDTGFCNYECTKCGEVCPSGAIIPLTKDIKKITQIGTVVFERDHCVVFKSEKSCGSCSEHCPTQAVHMISYKGFLTIPETNPEICIGCGACEHVCPVTDPHAAIFIIPHKVHKLAKLPANEKKVDSNANQEFPF